MAAKNAETMSLFINPPTDVAVVPEDPTFNYTTGSFPGCSKLIPNFRNLFVDPVRESPTERKSSVPAAGKAFPVAVEVGP